MQIAQARPPFVEFKRIALPDPVNTEKLGRRMTKDVDFAFIMQPGSRDQVERIAIDWLAMLKNKQMSGAADAYPDEWVTAFHRKYEAWKEGNEAPLDGTSVREWPVLSPAEAENFIGLRIMTIEDVAAMTEDAMNHAGMGSRSLRDKAREWLKGKDVAVHLTEENATLKAALAELLERVKQLETPTDAPRRGRPPKEQAVTQ